MASVAECEQALHTLANRMSDDVSQGGPNRTLTCSLTDLGVTFTGKLQDGTLTDISQAAGAVERAQIALTISSDDLIALVDGKLNVASAWMSGRMKIDANPLDLMRLRSMF